MNLFDKYKFFINDGIGDRQVFPVVDDIVFIDEKREDECFYRRKINSNLLFCKQDFDFLFNIENGENRCDRLPLKIEVTCGGVIQTIYNGYLEMNGGNWKPDFCEVEMEVFIDDDYTCLFDNWDKEVNLLDAINPVSASPFIGDVECIICTDSFSGWTTKNIPVADNCVNLITEGWSLTENIITNITIDPPTFAPTHSGDFATKWCREFVAGTTQPPGAGWLGVTGGYARPLTTSFDTERSTPIPSRIYDDGTTINQFYQIFGYDTELDQKKDVDNGRTLESVLNLFLTDCNLSVVSDFFNINPDNTAPSNSAYTQAAIHLTNILIYQKSDIIRANAFENATKGIITFKKLLEQFRNIFNTCWIIENGVFRIEHISYFDAQQGIDLTSIHSDCLVGKGGYSYKRTKMPQFEVFTWMDEVSDAFNGFPIEYLSCFNDTDGQNEKGYPADKVTTDISYLFSNPDGVDFNGFVIVSTLFDTSHTIQYENIFVPGTGFSVLLNGHLSFINLHTSYWKHGRFQYDGVMNDVATSFLSVSLQKRQEELEVHPFCCSDYVNFSPNKSMNTQLGWGNIERSTYSAKTNSLILEILHE